MSQIPSLGRVVLALVTPEWNNGADVAPAEITRVWSAHPDGGWTVNYKINLDGEGQQWKTSARLFDTQPEAQAYTASTGLAAAFWPPRV